MPALKLKANYGQRFILAIFLGVGVLFFVFPPYYGFMDDFTYLSWLPKIHEQGLIGFTRSWLPHDLAIAGRIRPFLPSMAYLFYGPTEGSYLALHLWNGFFSLCSLLFLCLAYLRLWQNIFPAAVKDKTHFLTFFFALLILFPWTYIGVLLPAMQEKIVFFAGAATICLFTSKRVSEWPAWLRLLLGFLLILAGSFVREQYVLFYPPILAAIFWREKDRSFPWESALTLALMFGVLAVIWALGKNNEYKSKYSLATTLLTLKNSRSVWPFLALSFASLGQGIRISRGWRQKLLALFPGFSLLGFIFLMVPWGLGGYLNTIAAPFFCACVLTLLPAHWTRGENIGPGFSIYLLVSLTSFLFFIGQFAATKSDTRRLLDSEALKILALDHIIYAPCEEGAATMHNYADHFFGYYLNTQVPPELATLKKGLPSGEHSYWIVAKQACWPGDFDPLALVKEGRAKILWKGSHGLSHHLIEIY